MIFLTALMTRQWNKSGKQTKQTPYSMWFTEIPITFVFFSFANANSHVKNKHKEMSIRKKNLISIDSVFPQKFIAILTTEFAWNVLKFDTVVGPSLHSRHLYSFKSGSFKAFFPHFNMLMENVALGTDY